MSFAIHVNPVYVNNPGVSCASVKLAISSSHGDTQYTH